MTNIIGVLTTFSNGEDLGFWCPGCNDLHIIGAKRWHFDGNYDAPTFSPSILVKSGHYCEEWKASDCWCTWYPKHHPDAPHKHKCGICHSFVRGGFIEFLNDCTHEYAGRTARLARPPR